MLFNIYIFTSIYYLTTFSYFSIIKLPSISHIIVNYLILRKIIHLTLCDI